MFRTKQQNVKFSCPNNIDKHLMRARYQMECSCETGFCQTRYKVLVCCATINKPPTAKLFRQEKCKIIGKCRKKVKTGISYFVKKIIDRIVTENADATPSKCHKMLIRGKKIKNDLNPTLSQVIISIQKKIQMAMY